MSETAVILEILICYFGPESKILIDHKFTLKKKLY